MRSNRSVLYGFFVAGNLLSTAIFLVRLQLHKKGFSLQSGLGIRFQNSIVVNHRFNLQIKNFEQRTLNVEF